VPLRDGMTRQPSQPSDRALADQVLHQEDERAFRALYQRHTPYLFQFVLRTLGGNELDAEDVIQETWIRAAENLDSFRWESGIRSWLTGIALNQCRGLFRRKDRNWLEVRDEHLESSVPPEADRIDLEAALSLMPDGYRTVLVLHDVEGYKHEEIGRMLGTSEGTSKSQLFHARRTMRMLLSGGGKVRADHA
jgi:RNA polymerase sigma-70 factor (ECF subfamily)